MWRWISVVSVLLLVVTVAAQDEGASRDAEIYTGETFIFTYPAGWKVESTPFGVAVRPPENDDPTALRGTIYVGYRDDVFALFSANTLLVDPEAAAQVSELFSVDDEAPGIALEPKFVMGSLAAYAIISETVAAPLTNLEAVRSQVLVSPPYPHGEQVVLEVRGQYSDWLAINGGDLLVVAVVPGGKLPDWEAVIFSVADSAETTK